MFLLYLRRLISLNNKFTVLIIEDESHISDFICNILNTNNYRTLQAFNGQEGIALINSHCPDIILLDLGLPDMDGHLIISEVRKWSSNPIIIVSARIDENEKVRALDLGADDYIAKPFGTSELLARIRTSLRHSNKLANDSSLYSKPYSAFGLVIDFSSMQVKKNDENIHLTPVEYKILSYLAKNSGKVVTHSSLMLHVWGPYSDTENNKILRVNMANIRRKIEENPANPQYIFTEVGVGYRLKEDEKL